LLDALGATGVSAVLGNDFRVTAVSPDRVADDKPRLNLFFYRALPNPGWAQEGLPMRSAEGERLSNPYLALDLHYLITAHGLVEFQNEVMLGYAMQIFHESPVLPRPVIRDALAHVTTGPANPLINTETTEDILTALAAAGLAEQVEQIKITPHTLSPEENSQLWSAFHSPYRPMAAYKVSVVLIRRSLPARAAPPVTDYRVYALPFNQPAIAEVFAEDGPGKPVLTGKKLILRGQSLRGDQTEVWVGGNLVPAASLEIGNEQIVLTLPAAARAGIQGVQVKHLLKMGAPETEHRGFESNVAAFVLQPRLTKTGANYDINVAPGPPRALVVTLSPPVEATQRVEVLLNLVNAARSYVLAALPQPPVDYPLATLTFPLPTDLVTGNYLVRVRVNGAESPLDFAPAQGFTGPLINL
jgi:hypothetical protein